MRRVIVSLLFGLWALLMPLQYAMAAQFKRPAPTPPVLGETGTSFRFESMVGIIGEPYVADTAHLNHPTSVTLDAAGKLYVTEEFGARMLRYSTAGVNDLVIGVAGVGYHHESYLPNPQAAAVTSAGHIWVAGSSVIKEFDSTGNLVQMIPETEPWMSGGGEYRFDNLTGVAISQDGRLLFVSDNYNQRVQVYEISGEKAVYFKTIGEERVAGDDDTHFNQPRGLAFDATGVLYVMDSGNSRVQKCTSTDNWNSWMCSTFFGGAWGDDPANGEMGYGITLFVDGDGNVFVTDSTNARVLKCDSAGSCAHFIGTLNERGLDGSGKVRFGWLSGITGDSDGNIYVSDYEQNVVRTFSPTGALLGTAVGVSMTPYLADGQRLNRPIGLAVDQEGGLYVYEENGARVIKYNAQGDQVWTSGRAGIPHSYWDIDPYPSDTLYSQGGDSGSLALDGAGNLYVPDHNNQRVVILNAATGATVGSMGVMGEAEVDNWHFNQPTSVAVSPLNGDIYVVDQNNQRVQVFNSARVYKATIGVTDRPGDDLQHFNRPLDVAIDAQGAAYVADGENTRIQKCILEGAVSTCTTLVGELDFRDVAFNHFYPAAVKVDGAGRVYVADRDHARVLVYDAGGAFLTMIGNNNWDRRPGLLSDALGLALDAHFNLYVADTGNNVVQKFVLGVPGWMQANLNGFGDPLFAGVEILGEHNGMLYASAGHYHVEKEYGIGAEIWRSADGAAWTRVASGGLGNANNQSFLQGASLGGYFYTGSENIDDGAEVWRCAACDGSDWSKVITAGSNNSKNYFASAVTVYDGKLYLSLGNDQEGMSIWRSSTGAAGTWTQVSSQGFGNIKNSSSDNLHSMGGYLYVLPAQWASFDDQSMTGVEVWRCAVCDGSDWTNVAKPGGMGAQDNIGHGSAIFNNALFVSTFHEGAGAEAWRCENCDGSDWARVVDSGFGIARVAGIRLTAYRDQLFALLDESSWDAGYHGANLYVTKDGSNWKPVSINGFGTPENRAISDGITFKGQLYLSVTKRENGGQIWRMDKPKIYVPLVTR